MVEQIRRPGGIISLRAGPSEADAASVSNVHRRAARTIGRQLAVIGDRLDCEISSRRSNWLQPPRHLLRPAQALTRHIYRDLQDQFGGVQGLSATAKAWIAATVFGRGILRFQAWPAQFNFQLKSCTGWTRGLLVTVALVAFCTALWGEWRG